MKPQKPVASFLALAGHPPFTPLEFSLQVPRASQIQGGTFTRFYTLQTLQVQGCVRRSTPKPYLPRLTASWADKATGQSVWERVLGARSSILRLRGEELTLGAGRSW